MILAFRYAKTVLPGGTKGDHATVMDAAILKNVNVSSIVARQAARSKVVSAGRHRRSFAWSCRLGRPASGLVTDRPPRPPEPNPLGSIKLPSLLKGCQS